MWVGLFFLGYVPSSDQIQWHTQGGNPHFLKYDPQSLFKNVTKLFQEWHFPAFTRIWRVWSQKFFGPVPLDPPLLGFWIFL